MLAFALGTGLALSACSGANNPVNDLGGSPAESPAKVSDSNAAVAGALGQTKMTTQSSTTAKTTWQKELDSILSPLSGQQMEGDVYRYELIRYDAEPVIQGYRTNPNLGADGYLSFKPEGGEYLVVGEMVLLDKDIAAVTRLFELNGVHLTALHNHLSFEEPDLKFLHFDAVGDAATYARVVREALEKTGEPLKDPSQNMSTGLPITQMAAILKEPYQTSDNVLQFTADRKETVTDHGLDMPGPEGPDSELHFEKVGGTTMAVPEFALVPEEVDRVVKVLRGNNFNVTAIHNHWLFENPRIIFVHASGIGDPLTLARVVREALDQTNSK